MPQKDREIYNKRREEINRYHKRRAEIMDKLGGECALCGTKEDLEVDHINPELKSFGIAKKWSAAPEKLDAELAKCQLLCGPCHRDKTIQEEHWRSNPQCQSRLIHGSVWTYKRHKCRCEVCVSSYAKHKETKRKGEGRGPIASKDDPIAHGTRAGYHRELRRGISPCSLCKDANKEYARRYMRKKREELGKE